MNRWESLKKNILSEIYSLRRHMVEIGDAPERAFLAGKLAMAEKLYIDMAWKEMTGEEK